MKRALLALLVLCLTVPLLGLALLHLPVFGGRPDDDDRARFRQSLHFDPVDSVFENRRAGLIAEMRANTSTLALLREWFRDRPSGQPDERLPEVSPDIDRFLAHESGARVIWFGHSSFLLNLSGTTILVDPVFGPSAAPFEFMAPRFQPPVLRLDQLPPVDVVLVSHDHYDHLDKVTIDELIDGEAEFVVPLGLSVHLERWGVSAARIHEHDWWQTTTVHDIEFTAAPSQHFSGRTGFNDNETLWASWIIDDQATRLYFSGDSGYDTHFQAIGERFGPFDVAFLENGQYDEAWQAVHLLPTETWQAYLDLDARHLFPVHWAMFELAFHGWNEPVRRLSTIAGNRADELLTPKLGQVIDLQSPGVTPQWWRQAR